MVRTAPEARGDRFKIETSPLTGGLSVLSRHLQTWLAQTWRAQRWRAGIAARAAMVWIWSATLHALLQALAIIVLAVAPGHASDTSLVPWADGPRAPFALGLVGGGRADIADFRGRIILVHFFATWCEPCRAEMASLRRLAAHDADKPLTIVAVNVAEVEPRVARFFGAQPVSFPVLLDADRTVTKAWKIEGLPTTIVLDTTLTPVLFAAGDLDWDRADIRRALEALLPEPTTH